VLYAQQEYGSSSTWFVQGDAQQLNFCDGIADAVVSFETIEHVQDPEGCVREAARVLRRDGVFVVSTPELEAFRLWCLGVPNPFHLHELRKEEFRRLLETYFEDVVYYGQGPIESADIASRQYIPEQYLDQILMVLRKEGLVKSVRGPKGGHMLAKPPAQITMAQVMQALEGYVPPMECLPNPNFCKLSPGCALREVWQKVDEMTQQVLRSTTIEELAQRHRTGSTETMYYI